MGLSREAISENMRLGCETLLEHVMAGRSPLDGSMSPQTKRLKRELEAQYVKMSKGWAATPPDYLCPGCSRSKAEIAYLDKNGDLHCWLVGHHDHMEDAIEKIFIERWKKEGKSKDARIAKGFASRSAPMIAAFDRVLVCEACNTVDSHVKIELGCGNSAFSFSPKQIRDFVNPRPRLEHEVKWDVARKIWEEVQPTFALRIKLIQQIVEVAVTNLHWYEEIPEKNKESFVRNRARKAANAYGCYSIPEELCGDKRPAPQPDQVDFSQWRRKVKRAPQKIPDESDLDVIKHVTGGEYWSRVDPNESCPICKRSWFKCIRWATKSNKWIFECATQQFYAQASPGRNYPQICDACAKVASELGKEAYRIAGFDSNRNTQNYYRFVTALEVTDIIEESAHTMHNIDNVKANHLVSKIVDRVHSILAAEDKGQFNYARPAVDASQIGLFP